MPSLHLENVRKIIVSDIEIDHIGGEELHHRHFRLITQEGKMDIMVHGTDLNLYTEEGRKLEVQSG